MSEQENGVTPAVIDYESEEALVEKARVALSQCNWVVGECASQWTEKYARGRTDADFGNMVGLSADQVFQRRRVWQTFHDVRNEYPALKWSHFYVAINWDDAAECLQWAVENQATIAEMRAWRRAVHGEDLTTDPDPNALQALDYDNMTVRDAVEVGAGGDVPFDPNGAEGSVSSSGEVTPYAPFRKDARGNFEGEQSEETPSAPTSAPDLSTDKVVKRAISGLRRIQQQLAELSSEDFLQLPPELINQLWDTYDELGQDIKRQG
ncbi:hypothetical protein GYB59_17690 [bacterium]|nr:hypothetical protein [bacterium]